MSLVLLTNTLYMQRPPRRAMVPHIPYAELLFAAGRQSVPWDITYLQLAETLDLTTIAGAGLTNDIRYIQGLNDGSALFVHEDGGIHKLSLPTANSLQSVTLDSTFDLSGEAASDRDGFWIDQSESMILRVVGLDASAQDDIQQFLLSTPGDLGAGYSISHSTTINNDSYKTDYPFMTPTGDYVYYMLQGRLVRRSVTNPGSLGSGLGGAQVVWESGPSALSDPAAGYFIRQDGQRFYRSDTATPMISEFEYSPAFSGPGTLTHIRDKSLSGAARQGIWINGTGEHLYVVRNGVGIEHYLIGGF